MKTMIIIIAFISLSTTLFSQEDTLKYDLKYRNCLKISPLYLINSTFQFGIEFATGGKDGVLIYFWTPYRDRYNELWEGYGFEFQIRHYFHNKGSKRKFDRLYFSPFLSFKYSKITEYNNYNNNQSDKFEFFNINAGLIFGYNMIIGRNFNLDFYLGGGLRKTFDDYNKHDEIIEPGFNGIAPKIGFDMGFNF